MLFRRKTALPALAVMSIIITYEILGLFVAFAAAVSLTFVFFFSGRCKANRVHGIDPGAFIVLLVLVWASMIHLWVIDSCDRVLPECEGDRVEIRGRVTDIQKKMKDDEYRSLLEVRVDRVDGNDLKVGEKILVNAPDEEDLVMGDRITVSGKIKLPEPKGDPNTFDYAGYLRTKGIYTTMYTEEVSLDVPDHGSISGWLYRTKEGFIRELSYREGDDTGELMRAILFGDKGCLDDDLQETFRMNGTAHILAVSGLHVGMLYGFILFIWNSLGKLMSGAFGRRGWAFLISTGSILIMYAVLAGFAPSVVRAVIMILLHIFAGMTGRYYDLKSATLVVFLGALVVNPLILFQSGFQMSFLAILSLAIILPYLRGFLSGTLLAGAAIQIGLMPYMIYQFNWLSLPAVLINVPVIFLAGFLVPLGLLAFAVSGLSGLVGQILERIVAMLCDIMVKLNELCCIEGVTAIRVCSPPIWFVLLFYMALVAFASESGRLRIKRMGKRVVKIQIAVILVVSVGLGVAVDDGFKRMDMVFVDVGQGDCMHLRVRDGPKLLGIVVPGLGTRNFLIDGGGDDDYEVGTKTLKPYLLKNGVRTIDGAFVSHLHTDHYKGICELARAGMVRKLYVYEANKLKLRRICAETGMNASDIVLLKKGDRVFLGRSLLGRVTGYVDVLWPEGKMDIDYKAMLENEEDENASSLILRAVVEGVSLLATGDLGEEGERELMGKYSKTDILKTDILKVGHHGSKYSSCDDFLDAVSPDLAVIQVSKGNTYGHPTPEVLERLSSRSIRVYRNDLLGAVGFRIRNGNMKVKTMIP